MVKIKKKSTFKLFDKYKNLKLKEIYALKDVHCTMSQERDDSREIFLRDGLASIG